MVNPASTVIQYLCFCVYGLQFLGAFFLPAGHMGERDWGWHFCFPAIVTDLI